MCGIAGKISFSSKDITQSDIVKMTDSLVHRGPDDSGLYLSPDHKIGLGHRRLSIIDLSRLGHQPMEYLNRYVITFNGEIYNFREERQKLIRLGYSFKSKSDTEVILALFDKYGVHCVDHLRGMFAFAIYDRQKNLLFCARDRLGKKPFKYYLDSQGFIFASELKAILTQPEYHPVPDYLAIHHYLSLQYCPAPYTGFVGIKKLEPGHFLLVNTQTGEVHDQLYWQLDYSLKLNLSEAEWGQTILHKLDDSVRLRLISDVPLGAFLSGGIDSSTVVALMAKNSTKQVKTFSIGFNEDRYNELPYARLVSDRFHTDHTEFIVKPDTIEILPDLVRQYEEPFADSSALATFYVSKLTRDKVTVALSGDGGDENFAGYPWYPVQKLSFLLEKYKMINSCLLTPLSNLLYRSFPTTLTMRGQRFTASLNEDYRYRYLNYLAFFTNEMKSHLYQTNFKRRVWANDTFDIITRLFNRARTPDRLDQTLFVDINSILPFDYLTKVDIASMANSLEVRSPFLDHEFLETTAQIPFNLKLKGLTGKYILKKSLKHLLPQQILTRSKKGFMIPANNWFKEELFTYASGLVNHPKSLSNQIFNKLYLNNLLTGHKYGRINYANPLWAITTLELWYKNYFKI